MGLTLGYLPFLHDKNLLISAIIAVAIFFTISRTQPLLPSIIYVGLPALVLWASVVSYNSYVFHHPLGPPYGATFDLATWTRITALLIDRRQGILVQMPAVIVGMAGLWVFRRRLPITVVVTLCSTLAVVVLNGTLANSFGGFSFVGRLQWEIAPVLLAFAGLFLLQLGTVHRGALAVVVGVITALYALEYLAVIADRHQFLDFYNLYNRYDSGYWSRDPYRGWWGSFDRLLPVLGDLDRTWVSMWHGYHVWFSVAFVLLVSSLAVRLLVRFTQDRPWHKAPSVGVLLGLVLAIGVATTIIASPSLRTEVYPASTLPSQVGSVVGTTRLVRGSSTQGAIIYGPNAPVVPGRYIATFYYRLHDPQTQSADVTLSRKRTSSAVALVQARLRPTHSLVSIAVSFTAKYPGFVEIRAFWTGTGWFQVTKVTLQKVPNSD
jgi:hypothetical protein